MSSAACLHVHPLNVHHSDLVARHNTSLIQVEAVLRLRLFLPLEVLADGVRLEHYSVCFVFDLHLYFFGDGGVVSDVQVSVVLSLLGPVLPDVRTKHPPGSSVDDVSTSMEGPQSISTLHVDLSLGTLPNR